AMIRVAMGSSVQLSTYDSCKRLVLSTKLFDDNIYAHFSASLVSGFMVVFAMNPFDVVSTRLYNEKLQVNNASQYCPHCPQGGKGVYHTGTFDCFFKTVRAEGLYGTYKGFWAHYFRAGPHTILTFVFFEQLRRHFGHL